MRRAGNRTEIVGDVQIRTRRRHLCALNNRLVLSVFTFLPGGFRYFVILQMLPNRGYL